MSQTLLALSFWLHALATVVFIGHYLLLSLIYLPVLSSEGRFLASFRININNMIHFLL